MLFAGKKAALAALAFIVVAYFAFSTSPQQNSGLANPAAVYCEDQGNVYEIRTDSKGGQYGVCVFSDGTECLGWPYFRGECPSNNFQSCDPYKGMAVCTQEHHPVCAKSPSGWETKSNACMACIGSDPVFGYKMGECPA